MHVYCLEHTDTFAVPQTDPVLCQTSRHYLGRLPSLPRFKEPFPIIDFWEYCCSCRTFWPTNTDAKATAVCPVCGETGFTRFWCHNCYTISFGSAEPATHQIFAISPKGIPHPGCPGCARSVATS